MADLVRVRANGSEFSTGRAHAIAKRLEILDEPAYARDGSVRPVTRRNGRPVKRRTSVAAEVEKKRAADAAPNEEA